MFEGAIGHTLVLITFGTILLGRRETLTIAKYFGYGLGRAVGTLQGIRAKYEESVKDSDLLALHSEMKKELSDMRSIKLDMSMVGSTRLTFANTDAMFRNNLEKGNVEPAQFPSTKIGNTPTEQPIYSPNANSNDLYLARLILAEDEIRSSRGVAHSSDLNASAADIVSKCITESILNSAFESAMKKSKP